MSQTKFHQIRITKAKVIHVQILVPKWEKTKKQEMIFWVIKRGSKGNTDWGRFQGLQIGARGITNRGSFRDFKLWQKDYKLGKKDFKSVQGLQVGEKTLQTCNLKYNIQKDMSFVLGKLNLLKQTGGKCSFLLQFITMKWLFLKRHTSGTSCDNE